MGTKCLVDSCNVIEKNDDEFDAKKFKLRSYFGFICPTHVKDIHEGLIEMGRVYRHADEKAKRDLNERKKKEEDEAKKKAEANKAAAKAAQNAPTLAVNPAADAAATRARRVAARAGASPQAQETAATRARASFERRSMTRDKLMAGFESATKGQGLRNLFGSNQRDSLAEKIRRRRMEGLFGPGKWGKGEKGPAPIDITAKIKAAGDRAAAVAAKATYLCREGRCGFYCGPVGVRCCYASGPLSESDFAWEWVY